jgi:flagellum-specific ATP synthase
VDANSVVVALRGVTSGAVVAIRTRSGGTAIAQVRSCSDGFARCTPVAGFDGVAVGDRASSIGAVLASRCGYGLLARCVDAWGGPPHRGCLVATGMHEPLPVQRRRPIERVLRTGVAAIDALCTLGVGQRVALFSGSGVGKSTLLRRIASEASADFHVVALIGERGREAAEAVATLRRSPQWQETSMICATAEEPAQQRLAAIRTAMTQAEWLCDQGHDVLLTVDSLTRVAHAWREVAVATGDPLAYRGYPASLIGMLAGLVERAGARDRGTITAIFAVLVDADDRFEPVTDAVRGLLDGHIFLSRALADAARFPPIDILRSSSRVMRAIVGSEHWAHASRVRRALAALERAEDLFAIGAYVPGGDAGLDAAVAQRDRIERLLFEDDRSDDPLFDLAQIAAALP